MERIRSLRYIVAKITSCAIKSVLLAFLDLPTRRLGRMVAWRLDGLLSQLSGLQIFHDSC